MQPDFRGVYRRPRSNLMLASTGLRACAFITVAAAAPYAWSDDHPTGVPALNSNPGAAYTIYLDFGGFNFTGGWGGNTGSAPGTLVAFDSASGTNSFNATEQSYIKNVWARAAEKYVGQNINVTTVDPAVAAGQANTDAHRQAYYDSQAKLMHTVITSSIPTDNAFASGRGGVSFIGVTQNSYAPGTINNGAGPGDHTNFVFAYNLANQNNNGKVSSGSLKDIGEAAAHENGHGLKLNHQSSYSGTTQTATYSTNGNSAYYAPIMGDSYGSARGLWRSGPSSASSTTIQNDIQLLLSNSGNAFHADGIGHTLATATALSLTAAGALLPASDAGFILPASATSPNPIGEANYTTDYYAFTTLTGGAVKLTVNEAGDRLTTGAADPGGTLDSVIRLLDASGNTVASATDPTTQLSTITTTLARGQYYVEIASAGGKASTGTESASYYDMGSYFLTGTVAVPEPAWGSLVVGWVLQARIRRRRKGVLVA